MGPNCPRRCVLCVHLKLVLLACLVGVLACSDDPFRPVGPNACDVAVQMAASSSTVPTFVWTPGCHAYRIVVRCSGSCGTQWDANTGFFNDLTSPIEYGAERLYATTPAKPLEVGGAYYVQLWVKYSKDDGWLGLYENRMVGSLQFSPAP